MNVGLHGLLYDDLPLWSAPFGLTLLDTVRMRSGINVLDIGSGSGFPMLELAERMGSTCMVYGLDPSGESIGMITAKKEAKDIGLAKIVRGVAEDMPFPDEYFGLIVSNNGLNNVADQALALAECFRVADDRAQMVLTVNLPHTMIEFYDVFEGVLHQLGLEEEVKRMHDHIIGKRKPVEHLRNMILDAGYEVMTVKIEGFTMKYSDGSAFLNHHLIRKSFMPSWQAIIKEELTATVFNRIEQILNQVAKEQGELVMSVPYACFDCTRPGKAQQ